MWKTWPRVVQKSANRISYLLFLETSIFILILVQRETNPLRLLVRGFGEDRKELDICVPLLDDVTRWVRITKDCNEDLATEQVNKNESDLSLCGFVTIGFG